MLSYPKLQHSPVSLDGGKKPVCVWTEPPVAQGGLKSPQREFMARAGNDLTTL